MKKSLSLCCLFCGGAALVCLVQAAALHRRLAALDAENAAFRSALQNGPLLAGCLFSAVRWEWQGFDLETRTATIEVFLAPGERTGAGSVTLAGSAGRREIPCKGGIYTALVQIPLFEETRFDRAEFLSAAGPAYCQTLGWYLAPRYRYLPQLNAGLEGQPTVTAKDGRVCFDCKGALRLNAFDASGFPLEVKALDLVQRQNSVEVRRLPLSAGQADTGPAGSQLARSIPLDEAFWVSAGTRMQLEVELTDGQGLTYRSLVADYSTRADGTVTDLLPGWGGGECRIYSGSELLYSPGQAG